MRILPVTFVLTAFSITMFGSKASIHMEEVSLETAKCLLGPATQIVATRPSHENMAKQLFGDMRVTRFADMTEGTTALVLHYRGAPIDDTGTVPEGGVVTVYLVEADSYQELEPDD